MENQIIEMFGYCGNVRDYQLKKEGKEFLWLKVEYEDLASVECACSLQNFQLGNKKLQIGKSRTMIEK